MIAELAARAVEVRPLSLETADSDPQQSVADTLTYLTNQQSRMNDPVYRRLGLPITSSHIESTVKQISRRVKDSEKFWTKTGRRSSAATPGRPTLWHRPSRLLLAPPHSSNHRHQKLQTLHANHRVTKFTKCVVRP